MDKRVLKSGQIRLRFKLNEQAHELVQKAMSLAECKYPNTALERISLSFLSGNPTLTLQNATGPIRFLVKLYPDQYDVMKMALETAIHSNHCEEDALIHICNCFFEARTDL